MKNKKLKIAITGNIGSGKTTFSKLVEKAGFTVINADELSKKILAEDKKVQEKIIRQFGKSAFPDGKPDKKFLAENVFGNPGNLAILESILHPEVIKKSIELMDEHLINNDIVFLEAALIYEADMEKYFDFVVLITAPTSVRLKRKIVSDNLSEQEFTKREQMQIPEEEKRKRADFIFDNNGSIELLESKVKLLFTLLNHPLQN